MMVFFINEKLKQRRMKTVEIKLNTNIRTIGRKKILEVKETETTLEKV